MSATGPRGLPLLGNMLDLLRDPLEFILRIARGVGPSAFLPGTPQLIPSTKHERGAGF